MKRRPTLYDMLLAGPSKQAFEVPEFDWHAFSSPDVARFAFDDESSRFIAKLLTNVAPLIMREHMFAKPPHHLTWIEFSFREFARMLPKGTIREYAEIEEDRNVGFLSVGNKVFVISDTEHHRPSVTPYWFEFHPELTFAQELERAQEFGMSRLTYRQMLFGHMDDGEQWYSTQTAKELSRSVSLRVSERLRDKVANGGGNWPRVLTNMLQSQVGTLKYYIAMLLLLTRPGKGAIAFGDMPRARSIYRGKSVSLSPHHRLTMHIAEGKALQRVVDHLHTSGIHHRLHSVRGHWAQTRRGVNHCTHNWEAITPVRFSCLHCEAKRWWRKDHKRGDANLGEVTHDFEVTV